MSTKIFTTIVQTLYGAVLAFSWKNVQAGPAKLAQNVSIKH